MRARVTQERYGGEGWLVADTLTIPSEVERVTVSSSPPGCEASVRLGLRRVKLSEEPRVELEPGLFHTLHADPAPGCRVLVTDPLRPGREDLDDVLLLVVDTLRADAQSTTLAAFAGRGLRVEGARSPAPWTFPAVAALLSGRDLIANLGPRQDILPAEHSLAAELRAAGWRTAAFVNNPHLSPARGLAAGFDRYESLEDDDAVVAQALAELQRPGASFVYAHVLGPHMPYGEGPTAFHDLDGARAGRGDPAAIRALYAETVKARTARLAPLLTAAPVVVLTSDHGEELFEHGGFEHGHALWEELLRVPLVFVAPGLAPETRELAARLQDVAPTLLGLLHLRPPYDWTGVDLRQSEPGPLFASHLLYEGPWTSAIVYRTWKLLLGPRGQLLFNLAKDPGEAEPLSAERPAEWLLRLSDERPGSALAPGPDTTAPAWMMELRFGGDGGEPLRVSLRSDVALHVSPTLAPRACGPLELGREGQSITLTLDVAPAACVFRVGPARAGVEVELRVDQGAGPMDNVVGVSGNTQPFRFAEAPPASTEWPAARGPTRLVVAGVPVEDPPLNERLRALGYTP